MRLGRPGLEFWLFRARDGDRRRLDLGGLCECLPTEYTAPVMLEYACELYTCSRNGRHAGPESHSQLTEVNNPLPNPQGMHDTLAIW